MVLVHIYIDGGCRHPGTPEARGYYSIKAIDRWGTFHHEEKIFIQCDLPQTNNVAEYYALLQGLSWIEGRANKAHRHYIIHTDSQLVFGQLVLSWKVKSDNLKHLHYECCQLLDEMEVSVKIAWESRENVEAVLGH